MAEGKGAMDKGARDSRDLCYEGSIDGAALSYFVRLPRGYDPTDRFCKGHCSSYAFLA